jgi:hypothetical protein
MKDVYSRHLYERPSHAKYEALLVLGSQQRQNELVFTGVREQA